MEETHPEAAEILRAAGWKPHHPWAVFTRGSLIMGSPNVGEFHVKNLDAAPDSPDTPDDPVAAAEWLVARFPVVSASEPEETPAHEDDAETGAEVALDEGAEQPEPPASARESVSSEPGSGEPPVADENGGGELGPYDGPEDEILDADFYEPTDPLIEGADFADEPEGNAGGAFIFGDNLHQLRTSAIGLVVQAALERMPPPIDYAQLSELRNFTMGVSEGRWPDNPDKREELDTLEATERLRRAVEAARDTKVAALLSATREEIEAFDVDANWP